jgi:hypothetical protein
MPAAAVLMLALTLSLFVYNISQIGRVHTGITAYAQPEVTAGKRFVLLGPDPRQLGGDPSWPIYAQILTRALESKGFVSDASLPDLVIRVTYRVGDTQTWTTTTSTPIMGVTGMDTQTTVTPNPDPTGPPIITTTSTPVTGVVGTTESSTTSSSSMRIIRLEAIDAASYASGKPAIVWSIHARSRGAEDDLAKVFPVMVASMENYFGVNAAQEIDVPMYYNDPEPSRLSQP